MKDKTALVIAGLLLLSGFVHLGLWVASGQAWEGAVSFRKPALFGISSGLTVWSLAWVIACLPPKPRDDFWSRAMAWALLVEVSLITLQCWRNVPSHFNHATTIDGIIERSMLLLILFVTIVIAWICVRSFRTLQQPPSMALAIRAGMLLLFVSCLLGFGTTAFGQWNLSQGKPYELWGKAGVLKFPHGIALHAIQLLPVSAWLFARWRWPYAYAAMQGLVLSQFLALFYAVWQTMHGLGRFDMDTTGWILLASALAAVAIPVIANGVMIAVNRKNSLRVN